MGKPTKRARAVSAPPDRLANYTAPTTQMGLVAKSLRSEPYHRADQKGHMAVARGFQKGCYDSGDEDTPSPAGLIDVPVTIRDQDQHYDLHPRALRFMESSSTQPMTIQPSSTLQPASTSQPSSTPAPTSTSYALSPIHGSHEPQRIHISPTTHTAPTGDLADMAMLVESADVSEQSQQIVRYNPAGPTPPSTSDSSGWSQAGSLWQRVDNTVTQVNIQQNIHADPQTTESQQAVMQAQQAAYEAQPQAEQARTIAVGCVATAVIEANAQQSVAEQAIQYAQTIEQQAVQHAQHVEIPPHSASST